MQTLNFPTLGSRTISEGSIKIIGHQRTILLGNQTFPLLVPQKLESEIKNSSQNVERDLYIHFHGPAWLTFQEHERANLDDFVVNISVGEGSTIYGNFAAKNPNLDDFKQAVITSVSQMLNENNSTKNTRKIIINKIRFTSFSAGYGSVRNYLRNPENYEKIQSIILCDSLYASLDPNSKPRKALKEHLYPFGEYIKSIKNTNKTFILSVSSVKTPDYACSAECADGLVSMLKGEWQSASFKSTATEDPNFPLQKFFVNENSAILQYGGDQANAHTTHYRNLASLLEFQEILARK